MNEATDVAPNPREAIGGNLPPLPALISDAAETQDFALIVTEWLRDRYGALIGTIRNVGSVMVHGDKKE